MIVGGALLLDRVANSHLHRLAALPVKQLIFPAVVDEVCRFSSRQDFEDYGCMVAVERASS
jgi:hypothetical protein